MTRKRAKQNSVYRQMLDGYTAVTFVYISYSCSSVAICGCKEYNKATTAIMGSLMNAYYSLKDCIILTASAIVTFLSPFASAALSMVVVTPRQ